MCTITQDADRAPSAAPGSSAWSLGEARSGRLVLLIGVVRRGGFVEPTVGVFVQLGGEVFHLGRRRGGGGGRRGGGFRRAHRRSLRPARRRSLPPRASAESASAPAPAGDRPSPANPNRCIRPRRPASGSGRYACAPDRP